MYKPLKIIYLNCNFMHINFDRFPKPLKKKRLYVAFQTDMYKIKSIVKQLLL